MGSDNYLEGERRGDCRKSFACDRCSKAFRRSSGLVSSLGANRQIGDSLVIESFLFVSILTRIVYRLIPSSSYLEQFSTITGGCGHECSRSSEKEILLVSSEPCLY